MLRIPLLLALSLLLNLTGLAQSVALTSSLRIRDFEPAGFAQWVDGKESEFDPKLTMQEVIWTDAPTTGTSGLRYGESKTAGIRHLRVGFKKPIAIGSVLVRGGGKLSALKAGAKYPGSLEDESLWIAAERLVGGQSSSAEVDDETFALWVFPPGTNTRALRFSHTSEPADKTYAGSLGGMLALAERWVNVAPQAIATADRNPQKSALLNNQSNDGTFKVWDNWEDSGPSELVSPQHPAVITLIWPRPIRLNGLNTLWAGFSAADVQMFAGPADRHPAEAPPSDWKPVASFEKIEHHFARSLRSHWLDFGKEITTRAIRLQITKTGLENNGNLVGKTKDGRRVWLGEILALQALGKGTLKSALIEVPNQITHPPIPIRFTLKEAGLVTLVIEDSKGGRVRNLLSETPFPAGQNTAWWDGQDDLGRDGEAARHGVYHVPGKFVAPGDYQIRGLFCKGTELRYEFAVNNEGLPPWETEDKTGCWMTCHTPPTSALFVPGNKTADGEALIYLGAFIAEGGHGLQWLDLSGKKRGGVHWVGGTWTGAPTLACDLSVNAVAGVQAYVGAIWEGELRLSAMTGPTSKPVLKLALGADPKATAPALKNYDGGDKPFVLAGLAASDGLLVCSLPRQSQLLFVDARAGKEVGRASVPDPRGMAFDKEGRLLVLSGTQLRRYRVSGAPGARALSEETVLIASGLEDPRQVTQGPNGNFYISDRGNSHQVKVFAANGQALGAIGLPGEPKAGPYEPLHMNQPNGLALDDKGQLWVAEADFQPKRVSVWTPADGKLVRAYYGPGRYGGGGKLDPQDRTKFYTEGMEFRLDWAKGKSELVSILSRPVGGEAVCVGHGADGRPEEPIYIEGRRYFTNCFNSNPTNGSPMAFLWIDRGGIARPVAACGRARDWELLKTGPFASLWPKEVPAEDPKKNGSALALWTDLNGDTQAQANEVAIIKAETGGVTVMADGAFVVTRVDGNTLRYAPSGFNADGIPAYDFPQGETLATEVQGPASSGGDQALAHSSGWTILTVAPKPFERASICGVLKGEPRWSYPSPWPGLHASHEAPIGEPGQLIGTTRLLGNVVLPRGESGPLFFLNGNMGNIYVFTIDGLFVRTLFQDVRVGRPWKMPVAERNMLLNEMAPHDENFWPSVTQTFDGAIYLVDGARSSLVRVAGLESIRRLPTQTLHLTQEMLVAAQASYLESELLRQKRQGAASLSVGLRTTAPQVDGKLEDWTSAQWAPIDKRGVKANFNSSSKPYDVEAAVSLTGDRLYAAFRTGDENLLRNSGEIPNAPFKTGGALDLMLATDPAADPKRSNAGSGDLRLLVTEVKGKTLALLYHAVGSKTPADARIPFSSPARTIYFDRVEDVSAQVQLSAADGNYEFSIPLSVLGLRAVAGNTFKGDLGILRGDGTQTTQRVYWANKATGITADVPSEAMLTPQLWGRWLIEAPR